MSACIVREALKERSKLGICPNLTDPHPQPTWESLTVIFYWLLDHEMDFEINLFFPHKSGQTLRNFLLFHIYGKVKL